MDAPGAPMTDIRHLLNAAKHTGCNRVVGD